MSESDKSAPHGILNNVIQAATRLPTHLMYGVLVVVAVVVLGIARANLQPEILLLVAFVVLISLVAAVYKGERLKNQEQIETLLKNELNRNTFTMYVHHCDKQEWLRRYEATCQALHLLVELESSVNSRDDFSSRFQSLRKELKAYQDKIASYLVTEEHFEKVNGELELKPEEAKAEFKDIMDRIKSLAGLPD